MRQLTVAATAISAAVLAAVLLAARPAGVSAADDLRSTITVVGDGRLLVQPDVAYVTFGVESTSQTLAAAQADAATRMQAVIDALVGLGVSRDDIKTSRLSASPVYDQQDRSVIRGYRVSNSVQVKLRQIDQVGAVVDTVTTAGANRVEGISFAIDQLEEPKGQARGLAMQNARAKADQLAALAGMRITGIKAIEEADPTSTPVRAQPAAASPEGAFAAPPPPVEPGTQEVRTQVRVTYIVE
jgi:uncharacterized protein YggE